MLIVIIPRKSRVTLCIVPVRHHFADSPNENNLDEMIQSFNAYIDTYNSTNPEQFDGK